MSAPDTNTETQLARHKPVVLALRGVMVFAAVLFVGMIVWTFANGQTPREATPATDAPLAPS